MILRNSVLELKQVATTKGVICYGAGRFLKTVISQIEAAGIKPKLIIDGDQNKIGTKYENFTILPPNVLNDKKYTGYAIVISSKMYASEIAEELDTKYGDKYLLFRYPLLDTEQKATQDERMNKYLLKPCERLYRTYTSLNENEIQQRLDMIRHGGIVIPRLPLMITTNCTLRCKDCSNLIPYYTNPQNYSVESIVQWINNLLSVVEEIIVLELVGGEPFIHKGIKQLLERFIKDEKIFKIEITTNGSVIPDDSVLNQIRNSKVHVLVSDYAGLINYDELLHVFKLNQISYQVLKDMKWVKNGKLIKRGRSAHDLQKQYDACGPAKFCRTVLNGRLFACSKAASLYTTGICKNIPNVDVSKMNNLSLGEQIRDFIINPSYLACDYCDMFSIDEEIIDPAEQMDIRG